MTRRRHQAKGRAGGPVGEAHVRLYLHELNCPAYRTMSPAGRALLVELRALYSPKTGDNRVFLSIREIMKRCNLSQRAAMRARDEVAERGWAPIVQKGSFDFKRRHATVFALENVPPNTGNGSLPGKAYMRWLPKPPTKKHGSRFDHRSGADSTTDAIPTRRESAATGAESTTETSPSESATVTDSTTQIGLPTQAAICSDSAASTSAAQPQPPRAQKRRTRA